jgi:hypothetical protein
MGSGAIGRIRSDELYDVINGARFDALETPLLNWVIAILPMD